MLTPQKTKCTWYQMSSLSLAERRLKPPTLWTRKQRLRADDSNHSFFDFVLYPYTFVNSRSGRLGRQCVHSSPVCPEVLIYAHCPRVTISSPFSFSKVPEFGGKLYGCSMHTTWKTVRQWRGTHHRQGCRHSLRHILFLRAELVGTIRN